ncbi:hypothetical protein DSO57_1029893 [Entomophthora muscae]|uniref:Uncharacterized protein n=1 Tax=Entomophthora muscae TaxID=34485 RepID=A0ACC2UAU1_9FUNG|nr:hypothetical protein DSO57_1029893 [Entomophthora muscae]
MRSKTIGLTFSPLPNTPTTQHTINPLALLCSKQTLGYFCSQSAAKFATAIKETQTQLVAHLQSAILDYKKHYDKKRIPGNVIQPSKLVLLSTKNLPVIITSHKFRPCFIRPFQVVEKIGNTTFRLSLP